MQLVEIALAPVRGGKSEPGDEREQRNENDQSDPVHVLHGIPPNIRPKNFLGWSLFVLLVAPNAITR